MAYIYRKENLKEKRVKLVIDTLEKAMTKLLVLDLRARQLINEATATAYISSRSLNAGDTAPLLPLGNEEVLNWTSLGFDLTSNTKFLREVYSISNEQWEYSLSDILEVDYADMDDTEGIPDGITALANGLKIRDGKIILKNFEEYDYDYKSYELLNEIARAMELFLDSVETFYAQFYKESYGTFASGNIVFDDGGSSDRFILVYDTRSMDAEINNVIFPIADQITDTTNREEVKDKYRELRDRIVNFTMYDAVEKLERYIDDLLFCVNGSKKYRIVQNIETRQLVVTTDAYGKERRSQKEEEVFFPMHNKAILNEFTEGIHQIW